MQNPKYSSPIVSTRRKWPAGYKTAQSPAMEGGSVVSLPPQEPAPASLPVPELGGTAVWSLCWNTARLWRQKITDIPSHPTVNPGFLKSVSLLSPRWGRLAGFRLALSALGCSLASLSTEWSYLTFIQCKQLSPMYFHLPWCGHKHTCLMKRNSPFRHCHLPPQPKYLSLVYLKK